MNINAYISSKKAMVTEERRVKEETLKAKADYQEKQHAVAFNKTVKPAIEAIKSNNFTYKGNPVRINYNPRNTAMPSLRVEYYNGPSGTESVFLNIKAWDNQIVTNREVFKLTETEEALKAFFDELIEVCD